MGDFLRKAYYGAEKPDKLNKYGFVSGGWLFDLMDRAALAAINKYNPYTKNEQVYTKTAKVWYLKQVCDPDSIKPSTHLLFHKKPDEYLVEIHLLVKKEIVAKAQFIFKKANHNYCDIHAQVILENTKD